MNKGLRVLDHALRHEECPQLTGKVELSVDLECLRDIDAAIAPLRRVVQFAKRSMPGTGVVPRVRAFLRFAPERLVDLDGQARIQLFEHDGEGGAHDPGAN